MYHECVRRKGHWRARNAEYLVEVTRFGRYYYTGEGNVKGDEYFTAAYHRCSDGKTTTQQVKASGDMPFTYFLPRTLFRRRDVVWFDRRRFMDITGWLLSRAPGIFAESDRWDEAGTCLGGDADGI